jgi:membrane protein
MSVDRQSDSPRWITGLALLGAIALAWKFERLSRPQPVNSMPRRAAHGMEPPHAANGVASPAEGIASPRSLTRRPWAWWKQVLLNTYAEIGDDRLVAVAAGVVFYALLAIFPAVTAFVSLYGLVASYDTINDHISLLGYVLPAGGLEIVREQIGRIVSKGGEKLGFGFIFGVALALWSANAGIKAMMDALNVIHDEDERRGFIRLNVVSLTFTLGAIVFLLLAVGAVVAFPLVMSTFGFAALTDTATWLIRWPVLLGLILFSLSVLYRFGPSRQRARWRWISPGSVFAAFAWIAGSALLSLYLSNFADYDATYGSLGAAIGLMMWMWLTTSVVLVGAELDSEIDKLS